MTFPVHAFLTSILLVATLFVTRQMLARAVKRQSSSDFLSKDQRRWLSLVKNSTLIIAVFGLILIWAPQLQAVALSLTAVAVALVVATKEMILCLTGAFMRVTATPFRIGDWVTVDSATGEVVDINIFSFRIQEIDIEGKTYRPTGKIIEIPNGKLFTSNVERLTFVKKYVYLDIPVTVPGSDFSPDEVLSSINAIVEGHYAPFAEEARKYNRNFEKKAGLDIPDPDPVVSLRTTDSGNVIYTVRAFVPTEQAGAFYRAVAKDILGYLYKEKNTRHTRKAA
jgi:small-conductance mechanosensitive channel